MSSSEEDVMKMRLLVDGNGTGDDKRLNKMLKDLIQWCNAEEDQQTCEMTYQSMLTQLASIEWNMTKSRLTVDMNTAELEHYSLLHERVKAGIVSARYEIQDTKAELVEAKRNRRNRIEYDALAKVIMNHSDRETSAAKLEQVKAEQKQLEEKQIKLEDKLDIRKKQFHALVSTIHQLQDLLAEDEDDGDCKAGDLFKDLVSPASDDSMEGEIAD